MRRALVALVLLAGAAAVFAQGRRFGSRHPAESQVRRAVHVRAPAIRSGNPVRVAGRSLVARLPGRRAQLHEDHDEVSYLGPKTAETSILGLDDPELFKHPIAYMAEAGFWEPTEAEAASFRAYLQKGGFVIFDDFAESRGGWATFEAAFRRVLPEARFVDLDVSHQIFHSFFEIGSV